MSSLKTWVDANQMLVLEVNNDRSMMRTRLDADEARRLGKTIKAYLGIEYEPEPVERTQEATEAGPGSIEQMEMISAILVMRECQDETATYDIDPSLPPMTIRISKGGRLVFHSEKSAAMIRQVVRRMV